MKKTLILAAIAGLMAMPQVYAADTGAALFGVNATAVEFRAATKIIDSKIARGDALVADTLSGAVALGEDLGSADSTDTETMIGGGAVLVLSNPGSGIGAGSSNLIQSACNDGVPGGHGKHEVGWLS